MHSCFKLYGALSRVFHYTPTVPKNKKATLQQKSIHVLLVYFQMYHKCFLFEEILMMTDLVPDKTLFMKDVLI